MDNRTTDETLGTLRSYMRINIALSFTSLVVLLCASWFALRAFGDYVAITTEARKTIAEARGAITHAEATLGEADATLRAAAPLIGKTKETLQEAARATERAESAIENAPADIIRSIPILNWFVQ